MIYHIAREKDWLEALNKGIYFPPAFLEEGFIHCSTEAQLLGSARRHFAGETELIILHIVEKRVKNFLKWEGKDPENLFPHIYAKLPLEAVETTRTLILNKDGSYEFF